MLDLFSFLCGVAITLLIESVILIYAKEWLERRMDDEDENS